MKNTYFIEKLELCCAARGMKKTTFCKDFGINESSVRTWIKQGNFPQADVLYRIAKYFGVPMEYFMDGSESSFTDREIALLIRLKSLKDDQIRIIDCLIDKYNQENQNK